MKPEPEHTWGDDSYVVFFYVLLMYSLLPGHNMKVRQVLINYLFTKNMKVTSVVVRVIPTCCKGNKLFHPP